MLIVFLLMLLPLQGQGQTLVPLSQVNSWFDKFITPYESIETYDAFVFSYFTANSSNIQTAVRGRCYSLAGNDVGEPKPDVSLFRIGSVTKLFTATAILQLYEKGLLDLNAPVVTYVPSLSSVIKQNMTVIDTLRHTTGVDERVLNIYMASSRGVKESLADASGRLWTEQLVSPGSRVTYSNLGVTIMGAVVEGISQQPLSAYFQQNIVKPLNLSVLKFHYDLEGDFTNVCYPRSGRSYEPYQVRTTPSGDLYTTVTDVSKFLSAHLNEGRGLFERPSTAELMHSRLYPQAFDGMAYMFQRHFYRNRTILAKDGGVFDSTCNAAIYPEYHEGVFAASTVGPNRTGDFVEEILMFQFVTDNYNDSMQPEFPFPIDTEARLSAIEGVYSGTRAGQKTPLKLLYLLRNTYLKVSGNTITTMNVTFQAARNVSGLSPRQLLLMANTSTSLNQRNHFMLVTFTDKSRTTVHQIEQYPDFNTLQPITDWSNRMVPVLTLFSFGMIAQLLAALAFPIICVVVLCKRQSLTPFHLMGLSLSIVSWMSFGSFISFAVIPYPVIFFGVQPSFVAVQVLAILMSVFILLWTSLMLIDWMKNDHCTRPWLITPDYVTINHDEAPVVFYSYHRYSRIFHFELIKLPYLVFAKR